MRFTQPKHGHDYYLRRFSRPRAWWDIDWPFAGMILLNVALWSLAVGMIIYVLMQTAVRAS